MLIIQIFLYITWKAYIKHGETPIDNNVNIENMGLAVFSGDKLIGELNGIETLCHLIITNNLKSSVISIPSPFKENSTISLYITLSKRTKNSIDFINYTPFITSNINIAANILSMDENSDYSSEQNLEAIGEYFNNYLSQNILSCLYKTSKEFKSDIFGFGAYAVTKYATWKDWENSDWLSNYENSFFKVNINSTIQAGQLFTKI